MSKRVVLPDILYANSNFKEFQKYLHCVCTLFYSFTHISIHLLKITMPSFNLLHHFWTNHHRKGFQKCCLHTISNSISSFSLQQSHTWTNFAKVKNDLELPNLYSCSPLLILSNFSIAFKTVDYICLLFLKIIF